MREKNKFNSLFSNSQTFIVIQNVLLFLFHSRRPHSSSLFSSLSLSLLLYEPTLLLHFISFRIVSEVYTEWIHLKFSWFSMILLWNEGKFFSFKGKPEREFSPFHLPLSLSLKKIYIALKWAEKSEI